MQDRNQKSARARRFRTGFVALDLALEIVRVVAPVLEKIRKRDADLARQGRKALSSIPMNIAEGNRRLGGDRVHSFSIAAGSADELRICLLTAEAFGYVGLDDIDKACELLDRELAILWKLTH